MQQATFIRAQALRDVGGFNVKNRAIWDAELVLDLALAGKRLEHVAENWALFTWHRSSISVSKHSDPKVRQRIEAEQERLVIKGGARRRGFVRTLLRAEARLEKWALDPVGVFRRVSEKLGRRPDLGQDAQAAGAFGLGVQRRTRVTVVSHAYLEPQIRKNIHALTESVDIRVLSPRNWEVLIFDDVRFEAHEEEPDVFTIYSPLRLFGAEYLLPTLSMGFRRWRPDVIHIEYDPWSVVFWQALVAKALFAPRARIVCHTKKNTYRRYRGWRASLKRGLAHAGLRHVDHLLAASLMAARIYTDELSFPRDRISLIPHLGVDLSTFHPAPELAANGRPIVAGYVGRFAEHKGVLDLVNAVKEARRESPIELHLLGQGPLASRLSELSEEFDWLHIHPAAPNAAVARFLAGLDIFALPSRVLPDHEEHDALALIEALACGVATVGTRSGVIPEILADGTGVLVDAGSVSELADALVRLARSPEERKLLAARGRSKAERDFAVDAVAARKAAVFAEVSA